MIYRAFKRAALRCGSFLLLYNVFLMVFLSLGHEEDFLLFYAQNLRIESLFLGIDRDFRCSMPKK